MEASFEVASDAFTEFIGLFDAEVRVGIVVIRSRGVRKRLRVTVLVVVLRFLLLRDQLHFLHQTLKFSLSVSLPGSHALNSANPQSEPVKMGVPSVGPGAPVSWSSGSGKCCMDNHGAGPEISRPVDLRF